MKPSASVRRAHQLAIKSRQKAYAPYSKFKVGAGLITETGKLYGGCNVENASYGGTVCAERVAILKAVSDGANAFRDIVVVTDAKVPAVPCALCLQTMAEFCDSDTRIWVANTRAILTKYLLSELLPKPFGPRQLSEAR